MATVTVAPVTTEPQPIIVDLGKKRRKQIRALKNGRGRLMAEVAQVVDEVKADLGDAAKDKTFVPVVVVYRRKRKKRKAGLWPLAF